MFLIETIVNDAFIMGFQMEGPCIFVISFILHKKKVSNSYCCNTSTLQTISVTY